MSAEHEAFELAAKSALPYAKAVFDNYILPVLSVHWREFKHRKRIQRQVRDKALEYLSKVYAECSYVNTIAFRNSPTKLLDIYIPLTLVNQERKSEVLADENCSLLEDFTSVLIVDSAGMGKSMIARRLALDYATHQKRIPIIFELRSFSKKTNLSRQLLEAIGIIEKCSEDVLSTVPFVFILDGLDEVPLDLRKSAAKEINRLRRLHSSSSVLLMSRPDPCLSLCKDFVAFEVKRLEEEQAFELLKKYDRNGALASKLISGIQSEPDPSISEFLTNPLYVSLLYCAYRHKPVIPRRKHLFYSEVYDAMFESHDLTKEPGFQHKKNSGLDSADFHCVLRRLGFWCLSNELRTEFLKDELELILKKIEENLPGVHFSPSAFVKDLTEIVQIFLKEGNRLRWSHKALLEYFAAMFICHDTKGKQILILRKLYKSKAATSYLTTFELCADIDYGAFRVAVVSLLLARFIRYADRLRGKITNKRIKKRWLFDRLGLTFDHEINVCIDSTLGKDGEYLDADDGAKLITAKVESLLEDIKFKRGLYISTAKKFMLQIKISILKDARAIIFLVEWSGIDAAILQFLNDKEPGLLRYAKDERGEILENLKRIERSSIPVKKFLKIDFSPKSILNNSRNFPITNSTLKRPARKWLDYDAAKRVYDNIKQDSSSGLKGLLESLD